MQLLKNSSIEVHTEKQKALENWFQTSLGRQLLADQRRIVQNEIGKAFGSFQLNCVVSHRLPLSSCENISHQINLIPAVETDLPQGTLVALPHELPFAENSVDLAILHHTLDFASQPHQTLRDISRVLRSGGHLLIIGFNPVSFWGLRRVLSRDRQSPWNGRFISGRRIEDWLELLEFKVHKTSYSFYQMPVQRWAKGSKKSLVESLCKRFGLPLGAFYCVVAQKQVGGMISLRPKWKSAKVVGMPVANGLSKQALFDSNKTTDKIQSVSS